MLVDLSENRLWQMEASHHHIVTPCTGFPWAVIKNLLIVQSTRASSIPVACRPAVNALNVNVIVILLFLGKTRHVNGELATNEKANQVAPKVAPHELRCTAHQGSHLLLLRTFTH